MCPDNPKWHTPLETAQVMVAVSSSLINNNNNNNNDNNDNDNNDNCNNKEFIYSESIITKIKNIVLNFVISIIDFIFY